MGSVVQTVKNDRAEKGIIFHAVEQRGSETQDDRHVKGLHRHARVCRPPVADERVYVARCR